MKSGKKKTTIVLKILLGLFLATVLFVLAVNIAVVVRTKDRVFRTDEVDLEGADCILVLGAGVRSDGTPSHMLEDRLLVGIDLYERGLAPMLLMSGDHGTKEYDEVNAMKRFAVQRGVDADDVFMDHAGFSTYESICRAKEIFGAKKIIIVSQEYHLYRAIHLADVFGIDAIGVSADLRTYVGQSARDAREIAARTKDFFSGIVKPKPKYLGDPIDLTGSGSVTNDRN
ncbi:MAG: YdcF family protein [Clostridia bacterium]|nr:YdcF family protein [Clostridia bacterium]